MRWIKAVAWMGSAWPMALRVGRRFFADACSGRAAGLAFSSLFALVPLSAFVIAVLTAFGAFDPLIEEAQQALIEQLVPAVHEEVFESVRQFASNTQALGFLGLFIFLVTAVLLLRNINTSFNAIWRFRTRRGAWAKVSSYTSIIVIGTALLSASFALGPGVQSVIEAAFPEVAGATRLRGLLLPPSFLFLTLFSLYILVPAGRVNPSSAALGAVVTVIVWEVAKRVFVFWSTSVMRFSLIYGSLAVLPIFLIWLYLTWFFILIGVEVSYLFQHRREIPGDRESDAISSPVSTIIGNCVAAAVEISRRHREGRPAVSGEELDHRFGVPMADQVRLSLARSGLFLNTDHGLLPSRGVDSISVGDIVAAVIEGPPVEHAPGDTVASVSNHSHAAVTRLLALWSEDPAILLADDRVTGVGGWAGGLKSSE